MIDLFLLLLCGLVIFAFFTLLELRYISRHNDCQLCKDESGVFECPECSLNFSLKDVKQYVVTMQEIVIACPQCGEILKYPRQKEI